MPYDRNGELDIRGAATTGATASRPQQRLDMERGGLDIHHRHSSDRYDETMQDQRYRPCDSPRYAPRQSDIHRDTGASSPRFERDHVRLSGDSYRQPPRSPIRTRSPPALRKSFRREPSPTCDSYRPPPRPTRPAQGDHYLEPLRRPSPTRRPSGPGRARSSAATTSKSPHLEDKDPLKQMSPHRNLTWTKLTDPLPTEAPAKIELNGIKDVPSGPAKSSQTPTKLVHQAAKSKQRPVPEHVKRSPHIFISSRHLPPLTSTIIHLKTYLKQHQPIELHMDETGYYLRFQDSPPGKLRLALCKKMYNGKPLFDMYTLSMQAFADGQPVDEDPSHNTASEHLAAESSALKLQDKGGSTSTQDGQTQVNGQNRSPDCLSKGGIAAANRSAISSDPRLRRRVSNQVSMSDPAQPEPPFAALEDDAMVSASRSSPPRSTARTFYDDGASSISGHTSEVSASGGPCHVCKARSELDTLVGCATCPRRYHRYCHVTTTIPADPGPTWQCQRCVQQKRPPKRALNDSMILDAADPSAVSGGSPAKKIKLTSTIVEPSSIPDNEAAAVEANTQSAANVHGSLLVVDADREHVEENRFAETIATLIGKNVGQDDFVIPSETSAEALGSQYSIEIAKALNMHPSLDGPLRRRVCDVMISRLAADRTILKELISGKSDIDMLITSSCTPAEGKKKVAVSQAIPKADVGHIVRTGSAEDNSVREKPETPTNDLVVAPAANQHSTATNQAPAQSLSSVPTTEADDLVEQSFTTGNVPGKAGASDTLQRAGKLGRIRRKIKPVDHNTPLHPVRHAASPQLPETEDATRYATKDATQDATQDASTDSSETPAITNVTQPPSAAFTAEKKLQIGGPTTVPAKHPDPKMTAASKDTIAADTVSNKRDGIASATPISGTARRSKPQPNKRAIVGCVGCGKVKVPRTPSGRLLCVQCKQKAVSEAQVAPGVEPDVEASPALEETTETLLMPKEPVLDNPSQEDSSAGQTRNTADSLNVDVEDNEQSASELECADCRRRHIRCNHRTSQEMACKDCRRQHKECNHQLRSTLSVPCEDCRKRHTRCDHMSNDNEDEDEHEDDDLDFWSTKPTSSCERCGEVHDATACPVQSSAIAEPLSASDQLFAVIQRSQRKQDEIGEGTNSTPQQPKPKCLSQEDTEAAQPPSQAQRKKLKHTSYRRPAIDENDLGDSNTRPKGTYSRLIGMALYEAPGNRLDPASAVKWVAEHIPRYRAGQGTWESGLKATMIHDAKSRKSTRRSARVLEDGRIFYQMLPHMVETHERWSHELQRPVMPGGLARSTHNTEDDTTWEVGDSDESLGSPELSRSSQAKSSRQTPAQHPQGHPANDEDETDIDHDEPTVPVVGGKSLTGANERSEDEPLAAEQKQSSTAPVARMASIRSPLRAAKGVGSKKPEYQAIEKSIGKQSGLVRMPDELLLRALVRDELAEQEFSVQCPKDEWPELYPDLQIDRTAKMAEIKARPRQKKMFGKAPAAGTVNDLGDWHHRKRIPFRVLPDDPFPGALHDEEEDGTGLQRCKRLEHFLDVPDDLEPHVLGGQLVYRHRNGHARMVYKTGI